MSGSHALGDYVAFNYMGTPKRGYIVAYGESSDAYIIDSNGTKYLVREKDIQHD
jgi:hypothetical protein